MYTISANVWGIRPQPSPCNVTKEPSQPSLAPHLVCDWSDLAMLSSYWLKVSHVTASSTWFNVNLWTGQTSSGPQNQASFHPWAYVKRSRAISDKGKVKKSGIFLFLMGGGQGGSFSTYYFIFYCFNWKIIESFFLGFFNSENTLFLKLLKNSLFSEKKFFLLFWGPDQTLENSTYLTLP